MKRFVLLISSLLLAAPALAEELPWSTANTVAGTGAVMLAAGDLDRDGDVDLVSIDEAGNLLTVHLNNGDGTGWTTNTLAVTAPYSVDIADYDQDGDLDLTTSSVTGGTLDIWQNDGTGASWTQQGRTLGGLTGGDVVFADLDSNGAVDLLNGQNLGAGIGYGTNPGGSVGVALILNGSIVGATAVEAADLDRDGDLDPIFAGAGVINWADMSHWDLVSGCSQPCGTGVGGTLATLADVFDLEVGDVDADGDLDLIASTTGAGDAVVWFANDGSGSFGVAQTILASAGGPGRITAGDLDLDGDLDVLLSAGTDNDVLFLENTGAGATWTSRTVDGSLTGATHAISADMDGDGDLDVIAAGSGAVVWHENQRVHSTVTFPTATTSTPDAQFSSPSSVRFYDFDRDGDLDTVHAHGNGRATWLENTNGDGSNWGFTMLSSSLSNPGDAGAIDADRDGDFDAVVLNTVNHSLKWFENTDGAATFGGVQSIAGGLGSPRGIAYADMDGDGDEDIVASSFNNDAVYWWAAPQGGVTTWTQTTIYSGTNNQLDGPNAVTTGDIDGDGDQDVVVSASGSWEVIWLSNNGDGTSFTRVQIDDDANAGYGGVALADMDADGDLDVIRGANTNHATEPGLYWYENDTPNLANWSGFEVDSSSSVGWVDASDLDFDGDVDFACQNSNTIYTLINDGAGGFTRTNLITSWGDGSWVGDVNGDGHPDIAAVEESNGEFKWWASSNQQADVSSAALSPACTGGTPGCVEEGTAEAVLSITLDHSFGRTGDTDIELGVLDLLLEKDVSTAATPMSDGEAANAFSALEVWADDGDGSFNAASDTEVLNISAFTLTAGTLSVAVPSSAGNAVSFGDTRTFFLVVDAAGTAVANAVDDLRITWQPTASAVIHHAGTDVPVLLDGGVSDQAVTFSIDALDSDNDGDPDTTDCNDSDATVFSGATETCNLVDDDCDSSTDEDFDTDGDFYFDDADAGCVTTYTASGFLDCDGGDATINPTVSEVCDGVDEDCDNAIDEDFDQDFDTYFDDFDAGCQATYSGTVGTDCNDGDSLSFPGATEICDGDDQDCDGVVDDDYDLDQDLAYDGNDPACVAEWGAANVDCDDNVATTNPSATETCNNVDDDCDTVVDDGFDVDTDGFFTAADAGCVTTYGANADCDDGDITQFPGATEVCNRADDDCDGTIPADETDNDGDTFVECEASADCDDADSAQFPGATEVCNAEDDDCDTVVDEGFDGDGDTFFTSADAGCLAAYGANVDCDDAVASISPAGTELCDGVDQDCDSVIDEDFDLDADLAYDADEPDCVTTYGAAAVDCDDAVATTNPNAAETCNLVDDDCDTAVDNGFDVDGDLFYDGADSGCVATYAIVDCNDAVTSTNPGAPELCNGVDDDCDTIIPFDETDGDLDGFVECEANADCDDADATQFPGATEVCNGADDNCDGAIDDGFDVDGDGAFTNAVAACVSTYGAAVDCDDAVATTNPNSAEVCDGVDQDCDGTVDDGFDVDGDGVTTCGPDGLPGATADNDCDDADNTTNPTLPELCDAVDNDCDGTVDDGLDTDGDGITPGGSNGVIDGTGATTDDDCDDTDNTILPGATELCDFVDSDCDGSIVDEDPDFDSDLIPDCVDTDDDEDGDPDSSDCNDFDDTIYTGATESCDGIDSDCNGSIVDTDTDTDGDLTPDCVDTDDDGDGMSDLWEDQNGYDPLDATDATLDDDADGRDTLQEFTDDTDPSSYDGPDAPALVSPTDGVNVTTSQPELVIDNATSPLGDALTYSFEVYADEALTDLVTFTSGVVEGFNGSSWIVDVALDEDTPYWWVASASDDYVTGEWTEAFSFFIDVNGDAPSVPVPEAPLTGEVMAADAQELVWFDSVSPQGQALLYVVTVLDAGGTITVIDEDVVGTPGLATESLDVTGLLTAGQQYRWTVEAFDASGRASGPSEEQFFGYLTSNTPPEAPRFISPVDDAQVEELSPTVVLEASFDAQGGQLAYLLEIDDTIEFSSSFELEETAPEDAEEVTFDLADEGIELTAGEWFLRARATDLNGASSETVTISIFSRGANDPPSVPRLDAPSADLVVDPTATGFVVSGSVDPEGDSVTYELVVTSDSGLTDVLLERTSADGQFPPEPVEIRGRLWWSARAVDERGAASDWAVPRRVVVFDDSWAGCSAVGAGSGASLWFLALLGVGLLRRRAR